MKARVARTEKLVIDKFTILPFRSLNLKGTEHLNFHATDADLGPALISIKDVELEDGSKKTHLILRLCIGTFQQYIDHEDAMEPETITACAKRMCPSLTVDSFLPIISRRASNVIAEFDEKTSLQAKHFKFGVIVQKPGQFTEEEIFRNNGRSGALEKFLSGLGEEVVLRGHQGFSGGLDTKYDQTGSHSIYTKLGDSEIMFHVGPMLPFRL